MRTKFISTGSSATAARYAASASILVCNGSRSRKMPDSVVIDVDARTRQVLQWDEFRATQTAIAVEPRTRAHQRQHLADRRAFAFQVVGTPQDERDRFRQRLAFLLHVDPAGVGPGARRLAWRKRWECGTDRTREDCVLSAGFPGCAANRRPARAEYKPASSA